MCAAPSDEALSGALLQAPLAGVLVSARGHVVRANNGWSGLFGHPPHWYEGHAFVDFAEVPNPELLERLRQQASIGGDPVAASLIDATGKASHVSLTAVEAGADKALVVYARPTGSAEIPEAAFRAAPVGLGFFDQAFRFTRVNDALAAMFDHLPDELVGRSYADFVHPIDRAASESRMRAAQQGALASGQAERRYVTATGRSVWVRATGVRLSTGAAPSYFGVFVDVTEGHEADAERVRQQEQVVHGERLRTLGQIAASVAHEVNNPAAIAIGGVDLARRRLGAALTAARAGDLTAVRKHLENLEGALRYCEDGTLRIAQAARRLGSFSSLHGGAVERLDPNDTVRRALELVRNELRHRARLVVELGEVPRLMAQADRLIQAVTNLLLNAAHAIDGPADTHAITVRTWSADRALHILVSDTGVGMSRELRDRLFEPGTTGRGREKGPGLGLTVVHDVVRQHRGRVDVWSEPGRGSKFTLILPLENGLEPRHGETVRTPASRVLVIDDEPFLLGVLAEILHEEHEVVTAGNGREALALLARDTAFDAVLCDLMMPDVDGIEVHTFLVTHAPAVAARTVFCTGGAFTPRAESYLARSGVPVLEKPFTAEDVLRCLGQAAAGKQK